MSEKGKKRKAAIESDSDLARLYIDDATARTSVPPIAARDAVFLYEKDKGTWKVQTDDDIRLSLQTYHRTVITPRKYAPALLVTQPLQEAALKMIKTLCNRPDFFDDTPLGVAFKNGYAACSPKAVALVDHSPNHRCDFGFDFDFPKKHTNQNAFVDFLNELFDNDSDRVSKINAIREFVGACLLGIGPRFQKCLLLYGPTGQNGKSLTLSAIGELFPRDVRRHITPKTWGDEYYRAMLAGGRINLVAELEEASVLESSAFKAIIAGDEITARMIHGRPFNYRPSAGHIFSCNSLPNTKDLTEAFFRRWTIITLNRRFDGATPAINILSKIKADLPKIAAWSLGAMPGLLENNVFSTPPSAAQAIEVWKASSDQVACFLVCCSINGGSTPCNELFEAYKKWSRLTNVSAVTFPAFSRRIATLGVESKRGKNGFIYPKTLLPEESWRLR